jgi:hypothetical protein
MLVAEASEQKFDGQVFWLSALGGPRTAFPPHGSGRKVRGPCRIQRRPRDGFAPSSLFSPFWHSGRGHLSSSRVVSIQAKPVKWVNKHAVRVQDTICSRAHSCERQRTSRARRPLSEPSASAKIVTLRLTPRVPECWIVFQRERRSRCESGAVPQL